MKLGLSSPTYSGIAPADQPLSWLLDRCAEHGLQALEASLPTNEDPQEVARKATDLNITWIGYWSDDWVTPDGGLEGLKTRAATAFDTAVAGGISTLVIFGNGGRHNRFTREPPLSDQLELSATHLREVAMLAGERDLRLGLLPHLDYRGHEMVSVMHSVGHTALKMAFDTTNPFPVCEEPVDAAQSVLPYAVAVAFKDVQIYPHRSNDVTIWGAPIGQGSVDFDAIIPLLSEKLPAPDDTTVCIKLRLPPESHEHEKWMVQSLDYLKNHPTLAEQL